MFVLVTQRPEFVGKWQAALAPRGAVETLDGLPALQVALPRLRPAAVVIDHSLLGDGAPAFLQILRRLCGEAHLLVGDAAYDAENELLALAAGVVACCDATLAAPDIARVVDSVMAGGIWISRTAMPALADKLRALPQSESQQATEPSAGALAGLTQRQRDVAALVAQGASNKTIARTLDITDRTVKAHLTTIFDKLGLTDRLQLALYVTSRNKAGA